MVGATGARGPLVTDCSTAAAPGTGQWRDCRLGRCYSSQQIFAKISQSPNRHLQGHSPDITNRLPQERNYANQTDLCVGVGAFKQQKALVGTVIVKTLRRFIEKTSCRWGRCPAAGVNWSHTTILPLRWLLQFCTPPHSLESRYPAAQLVQSSLIRTQIFIGKQFGFRKHMYIKISLPLSGENTLYHL